jgi:hypothetical protein
MPEEEKPDTIYFLLSMPEPFKDKFLGFVKNLNAVNIDLNGKVAVEGVYLKKKDPEYAIVPKEKLNEDKG